MTSSACRRSACLLIALASLPILSTAHAQESGSWPETERSFFYDGAGWLLEPAAREKLLTADEASEEGMVCGGTMEIFVEVLG